MEIKFLGGTSTVTGSLYLVKIGNKEILIDCGLFQGSSFLEERNFELPEISPEIVILTHAHLDHLGRLPYFFKNFKKKPIILSTEPTKSLARIILEDSAKILKEKSEILGREPIYKVEDLDEVFNNWRTFSYNQKINFNDFYIEFFDAGHILGSSFVLIAGKYNLVFSGDLGNEPSNILNPKQKLPKTDFLVVESTYGGRIHEDVSSRVEKLEDIIEDILKNKGVLLIPIFAIEKAQEIIYDIYSLIENYKVSKIPIFLDSPLAIFAFKIYKDYLNYLKSDARVFFDKISYIFNKGIVIPVLEHEDSFKIWEVENPKIILAGSGMSNGGRIVRHEKHYLSSPTTTLLIVGFQAQGSLGRQIVDGQKNIQIEDQTIEVKAKIQTLYSYSLHADQKQILDWIYPQRLNLKEIFLVHGEEDQKEILKRKIIDEFAIKVSIPKENEIIKL